MNQYLPHEKLDVYAKALDCAKLAFGITESWPADVAVRDQMERAAESMVVNLVRAARGQRTAQGVYDLECSLGSILECAACLDIAVVNGLLSDSELAQAKQQLIIVARMEVGLRNAWVPSVKESTSVYVTNTDPSFPHESLAVYQRSLQLHRALGNILDEHAKGRRYARRIDELSTSVTLNIAEGNVRFSSRDHSKFTDQAEEAGCKLSACLDLAAAVCAVETGEAKRLLREIMAMLAGLKGYLRGEGRRED